MEPKANDHEKYVLEVRANTRRYIDELVAEIESLRESLRGAEVQREELEEEKKLFFERYAEIESQNNGLAGMYVATYRLHGSRGEEEVVQVIGEIVANLIGSEEMVLYSLENGVEKPLLLYSVGVEEAALDADGPLVDLVRKVAQSGSSHFCTETGSAIAPEVEVQAVPASSSVVTACVPLRIYDGTWGVLVIFGLLPQKPCLESFDFELLDLLGSQAGVALHRTALEERLGQEAENR